MQNPVAVENQTQTIKELADPLKTVAKIEISQVTDHKVKQGYDKTI
jgi:hypothetical protein